MHDYCGSLNEKEDTISNLQARDTDRVACICRFLDRVESGPS